MANEWDQSSMGCKEGIDRIMERERLEKSRYRADGLDGKKRLLEGDDGEWQSDSGEKRSGREESRGVE